ncbi:SWIB/MDM2 domain-containing protein [Thamnidium elegans]|nr:SWIB/MDM2 domain-containing protein [Thamnidium elegans]
MSNYSPMAHYNQSMQQQEQAVNKMYYNEYQQIQVPQTMTKKRKPDLLDETLQKKKPKAKKKKVPKIVDPNAPPKPKRKTGLNKPLILSDALSELMDGDKELSRPELVQKLWKYIKGNDLQDPADRRFILCDAKLKKIFDQDRINSFGMNKDLSAHLTKKEDPVTIETNQIATKDIVQQEPTPSEDNNTTDFLL